MDINSETYLVSIVIPCFNAEKFIFQAVESCMGQTYKNVEIIVVNDGSTDDSFKILNYFEGKIQIINQENKGGSAARNSGLKAAKGDYILFLDADDFLELNAIERQMVHVSDVQLTKDVAVYGGYYIIDECGNIIKHINQPAIMHNLNGLKYLIENALITGSLMYRTENLKAVNGFNESLKSGQEYDLNIRLFLSGVRFVNHSDIVFYHRNYFSFTRISCRRWPEKEPYFIWNLMGQYEKMLPDHYLVSAEIKSAIALKLASAGKVLAHAGNIDLADKHFKRAYEIFPEYKPTINKRFILTLWFIFFSKIIGEKISEKIYRKFSELRRYFQLR